MQRARRSFPWLFVLATSVGLGCADSESPPSGSVQLHATTLVSGLDTPWDLVWGPDQKIWVSERRGRVSTVDPQTGDLTTVGQFTVEASGESGLMGIALHPDFANQPYLYAMYSYASGGIRNRLVRVRIENGAFGATSTLLDGIPGASVHDGARLAFGPDGLLYVTTGDAANAASAQDLGSPAGKVLRFTPEGAPAPGNPFGTAVYSFGHRNPQGLVFHPTNGALYNTEHGPGDNDEVNRIVAGRNFGWPTVHGFCDDDVQSERPFCQANDVVEPLAAWTPTIAPSGADFYDADLIPEWRGSLLFTTLKDESLMRVPLSSDGLQATGRERLFAGRFGRLRDVLVGPRGEIYLATSNRDGRGAPGLRDDRIVRLEP